MMPNKLKKTQPRVHHFTGVNIASCNDSIISNDGINSADSTQGSGNINGTGSSNRTDSINRIDCKNSTNGTANMAVALLLLTTVLASLLISAHSMAGEKLSAVEFIDACNVYLTEGDSSSKGAFCKAYFFGYMAATDDVIDAEKIPPPYMLRALRTRIPDESESIEALLRSPYCLPKGETMHNIISKVAQLDNNDFIPTNTASDVVERVLKTHYLCERSAE